MRHGRHLQNGMHTSAKVLRALRAARSAQGSKASPHSRPEPEAESEEFSELAELAGSEAKAAKAEETPAAGGSLQRPARSWKIKARRLHNGLGSVASAAPDVATTCHSAAAEEKMYSK